MIKLDKETLLKSKTFCPLAFNHLFVQPNGDVQACCVSNDWDNAPNLKKLSISEAINTEHHKKLRKDMLEGVENPACKNCYDQERATGNSSRDISMENYRRDIYSTPIVNEDYTVPPDFEHIDIRFSNLCNLKCRMCNHTYSSAWYEDAMKLGKLPQGATKVIDIDNNIVERLKEHIKKVKTVYFAGGEPLLMKEHMETLKFLSDSNQQNKQGIVPLIPIAIHYNTNLKVLRHDGIEFIKFWKQFSRVTLSISCDGIDKVGEYQRVGFNTSIFLKNLNTIKQQGFQPLDPKKTQYYNLFFSFQYTVTPLNIMHLEEFIDFMLDNEYIHSASVVDFRYAWEPEEFNIRNIENKEPVVSYLKSLMGKYDPLTDNRLQNLIDVVELPNTVSTEKVLTFYDRLDSFNSDIDNIKHTELTDKLYNKEWKKQLH